VQHAKKKESNDGVREFHRTECALCVRLEQARGRARLAFLPFPPSMKRLLIR
jgi:hypothetical protein